MNSYVIDVVRDDQLIEIQTGGFSALKSKLAHLLPRYPIRVIYPVPTRRWIIKLDSTGTELSRRKSPKKGHITEVFTQLVYIPQQIMHDNFSLEVVLVEDAEVRVNDGRGSWRRKGWSIYDRLLLDVIDRHVFEKLEAYRWLLPSDLPDEFTTVDLAEKLSQRRRIAQKMVYCLREVGLIHQVSKRGNTLVYRVT